MKQNQLICPHTAGHVGFKEKIYVIFFLPLTIPYSLSSYAAKGKIAEGFILFNIFKVVCEIKIRKFVVGDEKTIRVTMIFLMTIYPYYMQELLKVTILNSFNLI